MNRTRKLACRAIAAAMPLLVAACSLESPDAMLASAKSYLDKKDVPAAIIQLKNALQRNPDLADRKSVV